MYVVKCFQNILCCVNDAGQPDPALHRAVALAKSNSAMLTLADADHTGIHFWQTEDVHREIERRRIEQLEQLARDLCEPGLEVTTTVLSGHPAASIIDQVRNAGHDLVLKTSRAESLATRLFFGETAIRLIRRCPCPVWILQPQHSEFRRVFAAVDTEADADWQVDLNRKIVDVAASVAASEQCELHVGCVVPAFEDSPMISAEYAERLMQMRRTAQATAREILTRVVEELGLKIPEHRLHCLSGIPGEAIATFSRRDHVDLIVMGSVMRNSADGFMIGNSAEKVLHSVSCSVLTLKPPAGR